MERKVECGLGIQQVFYMNKRLELAIPGQRDRIMALQGCDSKGRFDTRGERRYNGRITRIGFEGVRELTEAEVGDRYPIKLESKITVESVQYTFEQWDKEGRPLSLKLSRIENYEPDRFD